jgi:hypothetical protein
MRRLNHSVQWAIHFGVCGTRPLSSVNCASRFRIRRRRFDMKSRYCLFCGSLGFPFLGKLLVVGTAEHGDIGDGITRHCAQIAGFFTSGASNAL